jgi:hypothetical protein
LRIGQRADDERIVGFAGARRLRDRGCNQGNSADDG